MKLQIASWIEPTLSHLWNMRKQIIKDEESSKAHLGDVFGFRFSEPDYAGLPEKVYSKIPDSLANIIHEQVYYVLTTRGKTQKSFFKEMLKVLTDGAIEVI